MHRVKVRVVEDALDANNTIARANRDDFDRHGVAVVNLMSAPGAGKTSLLERALERPLGEGIRVGVLEGDVQGEYDAMRIASLHVPVTQINTDSGFGGECHLDANMVRTALPSVPLAEIDLLVIENVGNLVCPAEFRVGEDVRVMVAAITEGEDKPLKYPLMYRTCELVLINKVDLLPHLEVDLEELLANIDAVHPDVETIVVSARTGEGVEEWRRWLAERVARRAAAPVGVSRTVTEPAAELLARGLAARREAGGAAVRARGGAHRRALPCRRRALRARRPPAGLRMLARRRLGRAPRRGRVRAPGDRGQAGAARARAARRARTGWRDEVALLARADDVVLAFGDAEDAAALSGGARGRARRAAALTVAFAPLGADWEIEPPSGDPYVRQELVETVYHIVWELSHVFFEHRGLLQRAHASAAATTPAPRASSTRS